MGVVRVFSAMQHLNPAFAQFAEQTFDLDEWSDVLLDVCFQEAPVVVFVESVEIGGDLSACLMVECSPEFGNDALSSLDLFVDYFETMPVVLVALHGGVGLRHKAQRSIVEHEDELARTCGQDGLSLVGSSVAIGHHGIQDSLATLDRSGEFTNCALIMPG